jgi:hypothetical protein
MRSLNYSGGPGVAYSHKVLRFLEVMEERGVQKNPYWSVNVKSETFDTEVQHLAFRPLDTFKAQKFISQNCWIETNWNWSTELLTDASIREWDYYTVFQNALLYLPCIRIIINVQQTPMRHYIRHGSHADSAVHVTK